MRAPGSGSSSQSALGRCTMGLREGGTSQGGRRTPLGPAVPPIKRDSPAHVPAGTSVGRSRVNALRQDWPQAAPPAARSKSWPDRSMACITTASFRATATAARRAARLGAPQVIQLDHDQLVPGVQEVHRASSPRPSRLLPLAFSGRMSLHPCSKPRLLQGAVLVGERDAGVAVPLPRRGWRSNRDSAALLLSALLGGLVAAL